MLHLQNTGLFVPSAMAGLLVSTGLRFAYRAIWQMSGATEDPSSHRLDLPGGWNLATH